MKVGSVFASVSQPYQRAIPRARSTNVFDAKLVHSYRREGTLLAGDIGSAAISNAENQNNAGCYPEAGFSDLGLRHGLWLARDCRSCKHAGTGASCAL